MGKYFKARDMDKNIIGESANSTIALSNGKLIFLPNLQHDLYLLIISITLTTRAFRGSFENSHLEGFQAFSRTVDTQAEKIFP